MCENGVAEAGPFVPFSSTFRDLPPVGLPWSCLGSPRLPRRVPLGPVRGPPQPLMGPPLLRLGASGLFLV